MSHAFGHLVLEHAEKCKGLSCMYNGRDLLEREADIFAAELLAEARGIRDIDALSDICGVSKEMIKIKIREIYPKKP